MEIFSHPNHQLFGLSGGIATGKSSAARFLSLHFPIVDADAIAKSAVSPGSDALEAIRLAFGDDYLQADGSLDRMRLGQLIFTDKMARSLLNQIVHPKVAAMAKAQITDLFKSGHPAVIYDVPLLFENRMQGLFSETILVTCSPEQQLNRLIQRDSISQQQAHDRIGAQMPLHEKEELADILIDNSGDVNDLELRVAALARYIHARTSSSHG